MFNKRLYQTNQGHELNYHLNAAMDDPMSEHDSAN